MKLIKDQERYISILDSGNCNFRYITHLVYYLENPETAIGHVLTSTDRPLNSYSRYNGKLQKPDYKRPHTGMFIFAQGSDDSIEKRPYARKFKEAIEKYGLGKVIETGPVPNPRHNNKPGYVYLWIIDEPACAKWWQDHVRDQTLEPKKEPECASIAEMTNPIPVVTAQEAADIVRDVASVVAKLVRKPRVRKKKLPGFLHEQS